MLIILLLLRLESLGPAPTADAAGAGGSILPTAYRVRVRVVPSSFVSANGNLTILQKLTTTLKFKVEVRCLVRFLRLFLRLPLCQISIGKYGRQTPIA